MTTYGYFLSCEEFTPAQLVEQARMAERAGFEALWISDHFHPWNDEQGQSPFVWSVIGALSQVTSLPVSTAVTCPTIRLHPAIVAQAAATASVQLEGRFVLGVGSGEALNEHVLGDPWPSADVRLEMLEEAVRGHPPAARRGRQGLPRRALHGRERPGLHAAEGARADLRLRVRRQVRRRWPAGSATGSAAPSPTPSSSAPSATPAAGASRCRAGFKVCYGPDEQAAVETAHRLWANEQLPGELAQVLPTPAHFEQASSLVTPDMVGEAVVCGPDADRHAENVRQFEQAGYDEVYVQQIGPDQEQFFRFWSEEVLPKLR